MGLKYAILTVILFLGFTAFALEFELRGEQSRKLRAIQSKYDSGKREAALNDCLLELRSLKKQGHSVADLKYRVELTKLALISAGQPNKEAVAHYSEAAQYAHRRQVDNVNEMLALPETLIHPLNFIAAQLGSTGNDELVAAKIQKVLQPLSSAIDAGTPVSEQALEEISNYLVTLNEISAPGISEVMAPVAAELGTLFIKAIQKNDIESASMVRRVQIAAEPAGRSRALAKFRAWHTNRAGGRFKKALSYLDCDSPEKLAGTKVDRGTALELRGQCEFNRVRTYSSLLDASALKKGFSELPKPIASAAPAYNLFANLARFEAARALGLLKEAEQALDALKSPAFTKLWPPGTSHCQRVVEFQTLKGGKSDAAEACVQELDAELKAERTNPSHHAINQRGIALYYGRALEPAKSDSYAARAFELAERNRPNHGFMKWPVLLTAAQSFYLTGDTAKASDALNRAEALLKGGEIEATVRPLLDSLRALFSGKIPRDKFIADFRARFGANPVVVYDNEWFIGRISPHAK